jgi:mRNA-degrading endonuclease RelE of RelBE toxin-antitoxin system
LAIALLKKLCRLSKSHYERFKDFFIILNEIELGNSAGSTSTKKVKDQIKRALKAIRE